MRSTSRSTSRSTYTRPLALLAAGLALAAAAPSRAQTLSLTESAPTARAGDTVTFTVVLTPAAGGSTAVSSYDANIFFSSAFLSVGAAPFTPSAAGAADFPNTYQTTNQVTKSGGVTDLRLTYDNNNSDAAFASATSLGSFTATVLAALPAGGTQVTFGPAYNGTVTSTANFGGSEVTANFAGTEILKSVSGVTLAPAATPEPSQTGVLGLGVLGLGLAAWRKRRAA